MAGLLMNIWMNPKEIETINLYLNKDDKMLEWGAGGSTLEFSKKVKEYFSIEHEKNWYNDVKKEILNNKLENIKLFHIENNLPRSYPYVTFEEFRDYILYVHKLIEYAPFNKVLIDGRARVWCAKNVLQYITNDSIIFIHDWEREEYHKVLDRYEILDMVDRLVLLKKRIK